MLLNTQVFTGTGGFIKYMNARGAAYSVINSSIEAKIAKKPQGGIARPPVG
jgi:hypothetical protein